MLVPTFSAAAVCFAMLAPCAHAWPVAPGNNNLQVGTMSYMATLRPSEASGLPAPAADLELKYVLLGVGTQNYTCTTGSDTAVPDTTGAVAQLYDIGTAISKDNQAVARLKISTVSGLALGFWKSPLGSQPALDMFLNIMNFNKVLGNHYFTAKTPTFSLNKVKANPFPLALVSKKAEMDAPPDACKGPGGEGAVKWLQLGDDGQSVGGVNTVYRLETAGGNKPATCKGAKSTFEVPYAAQYWIYGPK